MALDANDKKAILLCVLKVLEEASKNDEFLTYDEISNRINNIYGLKKPSRNTIKAALDMLDTGFDIKIVRAQNPLPSNKGVRLAKKAFNDIEIKMLSSNIATARFLSINEATELFKRLREFSSAYLKSVKDNNMVIGAFHHNNNEFRNNLEKIDEAIKNNQQVSFVYNELDINKNLVPKLARSHDGRYVCHPFITICHNSNFYLVGSTYDYKNLRHYRIDRITDIRVETDCRISLKEIKGYEEKYSLDLANYFNEHINMFNGDIKVVKFKADKKILNYIWDTFGKVESIREDAADPDKVIFRVKVVVEGAKAFARQFCDKCEILEPIELRNEMRDEFKRVIERYK